MSRMNKFLVPPTAWRVKQNFPLRFAIFALSAICALHFPFPVRADIVDVDYVKGQLPIASDSIVKLGSDLFGDNVNLYNGAVHFEQTDISIPGNSSLPVALTRSRDAGRSWSVRGAMADWDINTPRIEGTFANNIGWRLNNGGPRCSAFGALEAAGEYSWAETPGGTFRTVIYFQPWDYESGINISIPGQGTREILKRIGSPLAPSDGNYYPLVSKDNWRIGCLPSILNGTGEGFVAISPDGVKYIFNWFAQRRQRPVTKDGATLERSNMFLMATSVTDRFGKKVTYTYNPANPLQLQRIEASDGRFIALTYNGQYVASATDGARTWRYSYSSSPARDELRSVQLPDNSRWDFNLSGLAFMEDQVFDYYKDCDSLPQAPSGDFVGKMTHPSGATGTFTTRFLQLGRTNVTRSCTLYPWGDYLAWTNGSIYPKTLVSQALVSKQITGVGLAPMTWKYVNHGNPYGEWAPCSGCTDTKVVEVTDPMGYTTRYTYGIKWQVNEGQLLKVEEGWSEGSALRTTTYSYRDAVGQNYPDMIGASQLMTGDYLSWRNRPMQSKVIKQQDVEFTWRANPTPSGFDPLARPVQIDRFSTLVDRFSLLPWSVSDSITYHDNTAKWVLGQVANVYSAGLLKELTEFDSTSALPTAKYSFGRLLYRLRYNPEDGTVWQRIDPLGRPTTFQDYYRGIPRSFIERDGTTQSVSVSNIGKITSHTNAAGTTTSFGYDPMGRLARIDYPPESWGSYHPTIVAFEQIGQDEFGIPAGHWRQTVTTGNARTVRYYDALWQVGLTQTWDLATPATTSSYITHRYDALGNKIFESYPQRYVTSIGNPLPGRTWFFDSIGRNVAVREDSELGPLDTVTEYLDGFQRRVTNPRGYAETSAFHALDQPTEEFPTSIRTPEGVSLSFARDSFGKALSITREGHGRSLTRRYMYDGYQRLCKTFEPESDATIQAYDNAGNVAWRASGLNLPYSTCDQSDVPTNKKVNYNYDALDRLIATTFGDGSPGIFRSYTPDGLLQNINAGSSNLTYQYDARRNLVNERDNMWGWNHQWVRNAYGHVATLIDPWGESIDHAPNALGESTKMGRYASNVSYHPNGAVAAFTRGNGSIRSMTPNLRGMPEFITDTGVLSQRYSYDANGNVTSIADERDGSTTRSMPVYDGLDRLRRANGPWGAASYDYDALDNLVSSTVGGRSLLHGVDSATNRLTSISGSQSLIFGYDSNGNVVQRGAQGFAYDIGNRMRSAGGNVYDYDGHGRRHIVWPATGGIERPLYTLDGLHRFGYKSTEGHRRYVYLGTQLIAEVGEGDSVSYQHADALGSPVARTDASGNVISRTMYEPYGATAAGTNPTGIGFTGHANDVATGLVYMQQRYYDPIAGRFLSVDPVVTNASNGSFFNRYVYGNNNPYKFKDPDGRAADLALDIAFIAADLVDIGRNGLNLSNGVSLAGNVVGAAIPFATGLGKAASTLAKNVEAGKAGEAATRAKLGDNVAGEQVSFKTSDGTRTRTDFVTKDKGVVETKTGDSQLTKGQEKLKADIDAGRPVTPVGQNAANAGLKPNEPTTMTCCTVDRHKRE